MRLLAILLSLAVVAWSLLVKVINAMPLCLICLRCPLGCLFLSLCFSFSLLLIAIEVEPLTYIIIVDKLLESSSGDQ